MNMRKLLGYFNNAITGGGIFLLLLWVQFFAWLRSPTDTIPAWCFYVAQLIMIVIICVIYTCLRHRYDSGLFSESISVRYVGHSGKSDDWILIVKNTPILEINKVVSICFQSKDNDIEETIAIGYVETKNDKGNFQIRVPKEWNIGDDDLQSLGHKLLKIKPVIDKDVLSCPNERK